MRVRESCMERGGRFLLRALVFWPCGHPSSAQSTHGLPCWPHASAVRGVCGLRQRRREDHAKAKRTGAQASKQ